MLNVFINTWGNYNEHGADKGEWVSLPMDTDELSEKMNQIAAKMGDNDPEFFINDYEWETEIDFEDIDENENILDLNSVLLELDELTEYDGETVAAAMEAFSYSLAEAIEKTNRGDFVFYPKMTLEDVAEELVEECYFTKDTPDFLRTYFDYAAFARDLSYDGYNETEWGVIYE